MAALRINDSGQRVPVTNKSDKLVEEANLDLRFFLKRIQKSTTGEGRSERHVREAVKGVKSRDPKRQLPALHHLRSLYDFKDNGINAEIVPVLVDCLAREDLPELQYVAARTLRYLAKEEVVILIENDAVPEFHNLLSSGSEQVQEQALLAVATLADYSFLFFEDRALNDGTINSLLPFFRHPKTPFKLFWIALKTLVCLMRFKPNEETIVALPALKELLETGEDFQVQKVACEGILYFCRGGQGFLDIIEAEICPSLVELLFHDSPDILLPVMKTISIIAEYGDYREFINEKALSCILQILSSDDKIKLREIQIEACKIITSITAGTHIDIDLIIKAGLIPPLVGFLIEETKSSVKEDAAFAICNAISGGTEEQVEYFVDVGCLNLLSNLITAWHVSLTGLCLVALERMLLLTIGNNKYRHILPDTSIVLNISKLHIFEGGHNDHIFKIGKRIINRIALDEGNHCFTFPAKKLRTNL